MKKDVIRNSLKALVKKARPEIYMSSSKKIDCQDWTPAQVREHVLQFGEFCESLAEALFQSKIPGCGLQSTPPQKILEDFAEHFSTLKSELLEFMQYTLFEWKIVTENEFI